MRKYLLAAAAAAAIATPAVARDNSVYVGIEAGILQPEDQVLFRLDDAGLHRHPHRHRPARPFISHDAAIRTWRLGPGGHGDGWGRGR
mgnify:CR=1 FL=1